MQLSREQFSELLPNTDADVWLGPINATLPHFDINTPKRIAAFLGNCAHESNEFRTLEENLNYSANGLRRVWPSRFPSDEVAQQYARNPRKIANRAYGNRMGNGPEYTGEGWKYRGRGIIQLTGKLNYRNCSMELFGDERLVDDPDLLLQPDYALYSACWFWNKNNLSAAADRGDVVKITRVINGGMNGHEERVEFYNHMLAALDEYFENPNPNSETNWS